ncbi:large conductance mechanosensitive channel protein MscL [Aureimonas psammosilenae]|uniref:large conductance mechanosensitive channel protein MscL n=1 Tax=Aureimonas psammosilenae TaxID=2495496 RepID=UPI001260C181|nr:large conductance mechanosensitive channel protein MscL [Aureimonas psammosilenae]
MLKEFKEFALKGNMVDLAIGIIIGAAFSGLVQSLVQDIIMPVVGLLTGGFDFTNLFYPLSGNVTAPSLTGAREQGAVLAYGNFITLAINFLIVAFVLFLVVKGMNRLKRKEEAKPDAVKEVPAQEKLLGEIRDLLATGRAVSPVPPATPTPGRSPV